MNQDESTIITTLNELSRDTDRRYTEEYQRKRPVEWSALTPCIAAKAGIPLPKTRAILTRLWKAGKIHKSKPYAGCTARWYMPERLGCDNCGDEAKFWASHEEAGRVKICEGCKKSHWKEHSDVRVIVLPGIPVVAE